VIRQDPDVRAHSPPTSTSTLPVRAQVGRPHQDLRGPAAAHRSGPERHAQRHAHRRRVLGAARGRRGAGERAAARSSAVAPWGDCSDEAFCSRRCRPLPHTSRPPVILCDPLRRSDWGPSSPRWTTCASSTARCACPASPRTTRRTRRMGATGCVFRKTCSTSRRSSDLLAALPRNVISSRARLVPTTARSPVWPQLGGVWPPTTYMVLRGLSHVGCDDVAADIGANYHHNVVRCFQTTGACRAAEGHLLETRADGTVSCVPSF
jgi:hypothetical protein